MLNKSQLEAYSKELEVQQRAAEKAVEQSKANLNAVIGARQAVAHLLSLLAKNEKESSCSEQPTACEKKEVFL